MMPVGDDAGHKPAVSQRHSNNTGIAGADLRACVEEMRHAAQPDFSSLGNLAAGGLRMAGEQNDAGSIEPFQMRRTRFFRCQRQQQTSRKDLGERRQSGNIIIIHAPDGLAWMNSGLCR